MVFYLSHLCKLNSIKRERWEADSNVEWKRLKAIPIYSGDILDAWCD